MYTINMNNTLLANAGFGQSSFFEGPGVAGGITQTIQGGDSSVFVRVIANALSLIGTLAVAAIIVAGIYLIVGGQEEANREKAKKIIIYAIVGLLVIIAANAIVSFVWYG